MVTTFTSEPVAPASHRSPFGVAAVAIALLTVGGELANVIAGLIAHSTAATGLVLLAATPIAAIGMLLAAISLMRRERELPGHCGLWLNGAIAVLAAPAGIAWALAAR
jgi:hypothetical protein